MLGRRRRKRGGGTGDSDIAPTELPAIWLEEGCEDGLITDRNFLTEDQVEYHAELVESQDDLDGYIGLATKILFREVFPKAWEILMKKPQEVKDYIFRYERCVLT